MWTGVLPVKTVSQVDVLVIGMNAYAHVYACMNICVFTAMNYGPQVKS